LGNLSGMELFHERITAEPLSHVNSCDLQHSSEVCLNQHPNRITAQAFGLHTARGSYSAFESKTDRPGSGPYIPLGYRTRSGFFQSFQHMSGFHMATPDII
jgi:hypothetical protein